MLIPRSNFYLHLIDPYTTIVLHPVAHHTTATAVPHTVAASTLHAVAVYTAILPAVAVAVAVFSQET